MEYLSFVYVLSTKEKGHTIPMDEDCFGKVNVQHENRTQIYNLSDLNYDDDLNNTNGFI